MLRIVLFCLILSFGCNSVKPDAAAQDNVRKAAQEVADAMQKSDFGKLIDTMPPEIVAKMGGKEAALKAVDQGMKTLKTQGFSFTSVTLGDSGEVLAEGANSFVVIPTRIQMTTPLGKMALKSFLLGISGDGGKSWKFVDGEGMEKSDKVLPKLPAKLKLPEKQDPEILKE